MPPSELGARSKIRNLHETDNDSTADSGGIDFVPNYGLTPQTGILNRLFQPNFSPPLTTFSNFRY